MTAPKHAVRVVIGGEEYAVRSELPPEYTRKSPLTSTRRSSG